MATSTLFHSVSKWFIEQSRSSKRVITLLVDIIALVSSLWLAFSLRYSEFYHPPSSQLWIFLAAPAIAIPIFIRLGLYRAIVRYIGIDALHTIFKAVALYTLLLATTVLLAGPLAGVVPRTVYGINALILLLFVGGSRLIARWWLADLYDRSEFAPQKVLPNILIFGASSSGIQLAQALKHSHRQTLVAFVDDAKSLHNQVINNLIVYPSEKLAYLIEKYAVQEVLIAIPNASRQRRNEIIRFLEGFPVHVRTLPKLSDLAEGKVSVSDIREVDVADLLGRVPVEAIPRLLKANITAKTVLVTGAGGSIGSELCRQIMKLSPRRLILLDSNEFNLYEIDKELKKEPTKSPLISLLGSVRDKHHLKAIFSRFNVNTVYHAAAYKHVPLVEKNITEGIKNNVFGTVNCAMAAIESEVSTFVLVSTDKAVRPTNIMGATKRLAELVLQALSLKNELIKNTRFIMVRFGNVLGSSGSVVPLFREQIANGGPVTVTDKRVVRYFMTIPEAAELVIQAGAMGSGGDVFVLDMGEPVYIVELAERMINLSGLTQKSRNQPDGDIEVIYTGLRPGEKLYEELLIGDNVSGTQHRKIMRAKESVIEWEQLNSILTELDVFCESNNYQQIRELLLQHVDGFDPKGDAEDWFYLLDENRCKDKKGSVE